jgi:hypothetical protein
MPPWWRHWWQDGNECHQCDDSLLLVITPGGLKCLEIFGFVLRNIITASSNLAAILICMTLPMSCECEKSL